MTPSTTGSYRFRLRADDQAVLRLSTSASASALTTIAAVAMWAWDYADTAEQTSAAVTLTAGESYLLESWQADGGSGDGLFVQWQLPDGTWQDIPSANLSDPGDVGCSGWCPPTAVDFTSASGFNASPVLTWTAFPGAASYRVYRWSGNDVKPTLLGTTSSTTFTDTTVTYQGSLGYNITAVSASGVPLAVGESYWPYHDTGAPTAPTVSGVPASSVDQTAVTLTASGSTDATTWVDHYQSRLSYDNGTTWQAAVDGASRDVTATGSTLVQFRAVDGAGNASTWTQVTVTIDRPAPGAPGTPTGTSPTSGSPTISWSATTTGGAVGSYDIYRDAVWIGSTNASTRTYTDAAVVSDGSHAYRVVPHRAAADLAVIGAVISLRITGTPSFISASTSGVSAVALGPGLSKTAAAAAAFTVRVGLADPSCYSLESVGVTGAYLRRSGGILVAQTAAAGGASFATDATFCIGAWVLGTASGTTSITATAATPGSDPNGGVTAATAWSLTNSSAASP